MGYLTTYYMDLIAERRRGLIADFARTILRLLSLLYGCGIALRNAYYRLVRPAARGINVPVVSVGNLTVGGTGKTPVAAHLANLLIGRNHKVALLLRGYKGRLVQLDDRFRDPPAAKWRRESDEAMVLQRRCPRARIIVAPDRVAAAREAVERGCNILVLDDGFQHRRLARDVDIVLLDATAPFGHGYLLPRGLLREPLRSLRRADLIILTRSDEINKTERSLLLLKLRQLSNGKPVIQARHRLAGFTDVKGQPIAVGDPTVMQAVVFAGIANFDSFRRSVESLGVHVLAAYRYPDHHAYTPEEITGLLDVAVSLEANIILTTEKDAVKLVGRWSDESYHAKEGLVTCKLLAVRLEIEFEPEDEQLITDTITEAMVRKEAV